MKELLVSGWRDACCVARFWVISGRGECIPQGLKPPFLVLAERAKPEGLAYLEAKARARTSGNSEGIPFDVA